MPASPSRTGSSKIDSPYRTGRCRDQALGARLLGGRARARVPGQQRPEEAHGRRAGQPASGWVTRTQLRAHRGVPAAPAHAQTLGF